MKKKIIAIAAVLGIAAAAIFICRRIEPKQDEPPLVLNEYPKNLRVFTGSMPIFRVRTVSSLKIIKEKKF